MPYGIKKKLKIVVFAENINVLEDVFLQGGIELVEKIKKEGTLVADVCLTNPEFFPKLVPLAKTLGQLRLMPNKKDETITTNFQDTITLLVGGKKINLKNDAFAGLQVRVGKVDFTNEQIKENIKAVLDSLKTINNKSNVIKSMYLSSTMCGCSYKISPKMFQ